MATIKINNKDYKIKQTIRAIFLWEQISERNFDVKTTLDNYLYFYCILMANNPEFLTWDEFLDALDDDPTILIQISKVMAEQNSLEKLLNPGEAEDDKKKD